MNSFEGNSAAKSIKEDENKHVNYEASQDMGNLIDLSDHEDDTNFQNGPMVATGQNFFNNQEQLVEDKEFTEEIK